MSQLQSPSPAGVLRARRSRPPGARARRRNASGPSVVPIATLQAYAAIFAFLGMGLTVLFAQDEVHHPPIWLVLLPLVAFGGCSVGLVAVGVGLARRRPWAWNAAMCIHGVFLFGITFPIAALSIRSLLRDAPDEFEAPRPRRSAAARFRRRRARA